MLYENIYSIPSLRIYLITVKSNEEANLLLLLQQPEKLTTQLLESAIKTKNWIVTQDSIDTHIPTSCSKDVWRPNKS